MQHRLIRFRIALALAGSTACAHARRIGVSESHLLRVVKAHRDLKGKVYRSEGLLLRVDDFIREQFQQRGHLFRLPPVFETGPAQKQFQEGVARAQA
jgi:hypothetical protein